MANDGYFLHPSRFGPGLDVVADRFPGRQEVCRLLDVQALEPFVTHQFLQPGQPHQANINEHGDGRGGCKNKQGEGKAGNGATAHVSPVDVDKVVSRSSERKVRASASVVLMVPPKDVCRVP